MGTFETSWGFAFSVPFFTKSLVASGPNWEIYQRTDPTLIALAFDGNVTKQTVLRNEQQAELVAWAEDNAQQQMLRLKSNSFLHLQLQRCLLTDKTQEGLQPLHWKLVQVLIKLAT